MKTGSRLLLVLCILLLVWGFFFGCRQASAQPLLIPEVELRLGGGEEGPENLAGFLQLLLFLALITLAPAFVVLMTSFTRIVVVLSFVRSSLATQQIPPNQVITGLALFMTIFVMYPTWGTVNERALQPYLEGELTEEEAWAEAGVPLSEFMLRQTREKDLALFIDLSGMEKPVERADLPLQVLVPSFVISELKTAFQMGFILFIPFLIIDMVVASTLMSMGMFMLPPVIVSLPFKILLFVLVDGWHLVVKSLLESYG